jgi:hypothetical protein
MRLIMPVARYGTRMRDGLLRDAVMDESSDIGSTMIEQSLIHRWVQGNGSFQRLSLGDSLHAGLASGDI